MLINGDPGSHISALDRGLQYGDGLFETIAVAGGRPCLWDRHYRRLEDGGKRLGIPIPTADILFNELGQEIGSNDKGVIKVVVTRGEGSRGYSPPSNPVTNRIVQFSPWPDYPTYLVSHGVSVRICSTRLGTNRSLSGIKHLNRLEQVMARGEWDDPDIKEGLMLDAQGHVIAGTMSNIFVLKDGIMYTPDLTRCGIDGVMRGLVLDVASELGLGVNIERIGLPAALQADAIMLTNSLIGIWPVCNLEEREYDLAHLDQQLISEVMSRAYV